MCLQSALCAYAWWGFCCLPHRIRFTQYPVLIWRVCPFLSSPFSIWTLQTGTEYTVTLFLKVCFFLPQRESIQYSQYSKKVKWYHFSRFTSREVKARRIKSSNESGVPSLRCWIVVEIWHSWQPSDLCFNCKWSTSQEITGTIWFLMTTLSLLCLRSQPCLL